MRASRRLVGHFLPDDVGNEDFPPMVVSMLTESVARTSHRLVGNFLADGVGNEGFRPSSNSSLSLPGESVTRTDSPASSHLLWGDLPHTALLQETSN